MAATSPRRQTNDPTLLQAQMQRWLPQWGRLKAHWKRFRRHPLGVLGIILIAGFAFMVILPPILMNTIWTPVRYDPILGFDGSIVPHPTPPSRAHLLGTDNFGRDVLSQLLTGAKTSFGVGILAGLIAVTISTMVGGSAGHFGGLIDAILMGIADVFILMPAPLILLILGLLFKLQWWTIAIGYGILTGLGGQAIIVKSQTLSIKHRPYIEAARGVGGGEVHIIIKHILPGLLPLTVVHAVFTVVGAVLTESLLSFFSRTDYYMSWGMMIWLGQRTFRWMTLEGQWNAIMPPAIAIMLFCSAFYFIGRALDEILNPRLIKL
jgi:peptide/nickel transport system permease protein